MGIGSIVANVAKAVRKIAEEVAERAQNDNNFPRAVDAAAGPAQTQPRFVPVSLRTDPVESGRTVTDDVKAGKSLEQIATERGLTYAETVAQLRAEGYDVQTTDPTSDNGDVRTTVIRDPVTGEVVTEYYDFQHDNYTTQQQSPDGTQIHSPMRDGSGRKVTTSYDETTGATTTRTENDLGDGKVVERTVLPDGTVVEKVTLPGSQPTTTVITPDGKRTVLSGTQTPTRAGAQPLVDAIAQGKTIDQIASESGLTREQVIAQLRAAGYNVTIQQPTGDNGSVAGTRVTDARTGTVVAASYHDQEHDMRTTQHVDAHGNTVIRTTDADGTVTERVTTPAGREIRTVTAPDGKKTVHETYNGHTLTTAPDGTMTLTNNTSGVKITIKPGTPEASLVRLFMDADPYSSDPVKAREGQVITAVVGQMLMGKKFGEAIEAVRQAGLHTDEMKRLYGDPKLKPAAPGPASENGVQNPIGNPPPGNAPSGGKWVPVQIDGSWYWADPKVAEAMAAEAVARGEANWVYTQYGQYGAQLDVYALDPEYAGAVDSAWSKMNAALRPHGLRMKPLQRPEGTLQDARNRLIDANYQLGQATQALGLFRGAQSTLARAIDRWADALPPHDTRIPEFRSSDSPAPNWDVENPRRLAEQIAVQGLFSQAWSQQAQGDQITLDLLIAQNGTTTAPEGVPMVDLRLDEFGVTIKVTPAVAAAYEREGVSALLGDQPIGIQVPVSDGRGGTMLEWRWVPAEYAVGKIQAGLNVELAGATHTFFTAYGKSTAVEAQSQDLRGRLVAEYQAQHPDLFDPEKEQRRYSGDYLGKYEGHRTEVDEHGQVWLVVEYEKGSTRIQLTSPLDSRTHRSEYRDRALNQEWQEFLAGIRPDTTLCSPGSNPLARVTADAGQRGRNLVALQGRRNELALEQVNGRIPLLTQDLTGAIGEHGPGTADLPPGTFPDGQQPVEIKIGDTSIWVSPEVAERYRTMGPDALLQGTLPIFIQIDLTPQDNDSSKQWRWVHPEVAVAQLKLNDALTEKDLREQIQTSFDGTLAWYDMMLSDPDLLLNSAPNEDLTRITEQERETLDGMYQPQFQTLLANDRNGLFTEFQPMDRKGVEDIVAGTFGPDSSAKVVDEIVEVGGDTPQIRMVPIFLVDPEQGSQQVALIAVKDQNDPGKTWYVDAKGRRYSSLEEFQDNNEMFSPDAKLVVPVGLDMKAGADGRIALDVVNARNLSVVETVVDPIIGITTSVLTVASFALPVLAPFAIAGGLYLGGRAAYRQHEYIQTGGEWSDGQSWMNMGMVATTVLPFGSAAFRTAGLMRNLGLSFPRAAYAGMGGMRTFGAVNAANAADDAGAFSRLWQTVPHADEVGHYLGTAGGFNRAANVTDAGAMVIGAPVMYKGVEQLVVHGDQLNGLQLVDAITGTLTGAAGTGLGARGLHAYFTADRGHFVTLQGPDGHTFRAYAQGDTPPTADKIFVPPQDATTIRLDNPALAGRTHVVVRDTDTGQYFIVPLRVPVQRPAAGLPTHRPTLNYAHNGPITAAGRPIDPSAIGMAVAPDSFLVIARAGELPTLEKLVGDINRQPDHRTGQDVVVYVSGSGGRSDPTLSAYVRDLAQRLGSRVHLIDGDGISVNERGVPVTAGRQFELVNGLWTPGRDGGTQPMIWVGDRAQGPGLRQPIDPLHLGPPEEQPAGSSGGGKIEPFDFRNGKFISTQTGEPFVSPALLETGRTESPTRHQSGFNLETFLRSIANDNHAHHGGLNQGSYVHIQDGSISHPEGLQKLLKITGVNGDGTVGPYVGVQRVPQSITEQAGYYLGRESPHGPKPAQFTILHHSDGSFTIPKDVTYFGLGNDPKTIKAGRLVLGEGDVFWDGGPVPQPPARGRPPREYTVNIIPDFDMTYRGRQRDDGLIEEIRKLPPGFDRRVLMGAVAPDPADPININQFLSTLHHANQAERSPGQVQIFGIGEWTWAKEGVIVNLTLKPDLYRADSIHRMLGVLGQMRGTVVVHTDSGRPNMIGLPKDGIALPSDKGGPGVRLLLHTQSNYQNVKPLLDIFRQHAGTGLNIVWAHGGGLGRSGRPGPAHLDMLRQVLKDPTLSHVYIDLSWDVVSSHVARDVPGWARLIREFPDRFIHGTDSVAAQHADTHFGALDTYLREGLLDQLGMDTTVQFLRDNFERVFVASANDITNWRLDHADWLSRFDDPEGGADPFGPGSPLRPVGPDGGLVVPGSGQPASTRFVVTDGGYAQPFNIGTREGRGYVNYLGDDAVKVNGERVDPRFVHVNVPTGSFLVIARGDGAGGLLDSAGNPLALDKLVDDIANQGHRPGQDVVLYVCGAGTRIETGDSPVGTSVAQELANRLGARVHAVDGDIVVGDGVELSGPQVTERPGLPLVDVSGGGWRPQENYAQQHAFWIDGTRRGLVADPFVAPPLTYGTRAEGSIDPTHLGPLDEFNPMIDGSPATAFTNAAFAWRGGMIILKAIYGNKMPSLAADKPLGMALRGNLLATYLVNETVFAQWMANGGITHIDPNQPIALQIAEKAFIIGFGAGNALLTGTTGAELVGGARHWTWDTKTTQKIRASGMSLLAVSAPLWTGHSAYRAIDQFASGHPVTGAALTAATLAESIFSYAMGKAALNEWAKVRNDPSLGARNLTRPHVMLGAALLFATGMQLGMEVYELMSRRRQPPPAGPQPAPTRSAPGSTTPSTPAPSSPTPVPTSSAPQPVQTASLSPTPSGRPTP